ncbi:uncharacterized protein MELLADRAFT_64620 [Melampsora larici-populina 98AG31]|uniref:Uncharacterized protein n=1 Tax=Melampsora larici-populina (strain 98AG31 / pathotype 3-4-7) TaxID=747676 RepID=F4RS46_MELLP|nr:uncharacterized protein MELLADRAFT_64620 [Melampsora larici-populina 98AG31]EGG04791.1 hypothetical protein MELLADRAFT_64620 [Melampsora larici-populina 98AG31]
MASKHICLYNVLCIVVIMAFIPLNLSVRLLPGIQVDNDLVQLDDESTIVENVRETVQEIDPMEGKLLQDDKLETWRDLRTIEEVIKQNLEASIFMTRVDYYTDAILKDCPFHITPYLSDKQTGKKKRIGLFEDLIHSIIKIMKGHSAEPEHPKLHLLEEELLVLLKNIPPPKSQQERRKRSGPFVDFLMSKLGWYLLLDSLQMSGNLRYGVKASSQIFCNSEQLTTERDNELKHGTYYRNYMHIFEIFEALVFDGLQNKDLILDVAKTQYKRIKQKKIIQKHLGSIVDIHRYLVNQTPWSGHPWSPAPFFKDPLKSCGPKSSETAHKLWFIFGGNDHKISNTLDTMSEEDMALDYKVPELLKEVLNSQPFIDSNLENKLNYKFAIKHMCKAIDLVLDLDNDEPAVLSILREIFTCSIEYISKVENCNECKMIINNSVMFYLFIRRVGNVLKQLMESQFPNIPLEMKLNTPQSMGYYWALTNFRPNNHSKSEARWSRWFFGLGKTYRDHLFASQKLKNIYNQMGSAYHKTVSSSGERSVIMKHPEDLSHPELFPGTRELYKGKDVLDGKYNYFKGEAFLRLKDLLATGELYDMFTISQRKGQNVVNPSVNIEKDLAKEVKKDVRLKAITQRKIKVLGSLEYNEDRVFSNEFSKALMTVTSDDSRKNEQKLGPPEDSPRTIFSKTRNSTDKFKSIKEIFPHCEKVGQKSTDTTLPSSSKNGQEPPSFPETEGYYNSDTPIQPCVPPQKRMLSTNTDIFQERISDTGVPKKSRTQAVHVIELPEVQKSQSSINIIDTDSNVFKLPPHHKDHSPLQTPNDLCIEKAHLFDLNEVPEVPSDKQGHTEQRFTCPSMMDLKKLDSVQDATLPDLNQPVDMTE